MAWNNDTNGILQHEKTLQHLFLQCNFVKACWSSIEIPIPELAVRTEF
jgi:hypothetical protein